MPGKMSKLPPKEFFNKMRKKIREGNPDYSDEQVNATVADIWYHKIGKKAKGKYEGMRRHRESGEVSKSILFIEIDDSTEIPVGFDSFDLTVEKGVMVGGVMQHHKYLRREGTAGHYRYIYKHAVTGKEFAEPNPPMPEEIQAGSKEIEKPESKKETAMNTVMGIPGAKGKEDYKGMSIVDYGTGYWGIYDKSGKFMAYSDRNDIRYSEPKKWIDSINDMGTVNKKIWELSERQAQQILDEAKKAYDEDRDLSKKIDNLRDKYIPLRGKKTAGDPEYDSIVRQWDETEVKRKKVREQMERLEKVAGGSPGSPDITDVVFFKDAAHWVARHIENANKYNMNIAVPDWVKKGYPDIKLDDPMKEPIHQDPAVDEPKTEAMKALLQKKVNMGFGSEMTYEQWGTMYYIGKELRALRGKNIQWLERTLKNNVPPLPITDESIFKVVRAFEPFQYGGKFGAKIAVRAFLKGLSNQPE